MALKLPHIALTLLVLASGGTALAQQAVSSITQSRLFTNPGGAMAIPVDANGTALPAEEGAVSDDESFGTQIILKNQPRPRRFSVFADSSVFHTNNVELTPDGTRSDSFLALNAGAAWRPTLSRGFSGEISAGGSWFRYDRVGELDFEKIWAGAGLSWAVPRSPGIIAFGRYDFNEVLDSASHEILQDHAFTLGAQKIFAFGRSHFLVAGISGVLGRSDPRSQERDQATLQLAYHLQITRSFETDLLYRYAAQFYDQGDRLDHNQTLTLSVAWVASRWVRFSASVSAARNDSNQPAFEYSAVNFGGGLRIHVSF